MISRAMIISLCLMSIATAGVLLLERKGESSSGGSMYARRIPLLLGDWRGVDHPPDPSVSRILGTEDHLMRDYVDRSGRTVIFAAAFAENNRRAAHPPEQCYRGQDMALFQKNHTSYSMKLPADGFKPGDAIIEEVILLVEGREFAVTELIVGRGAQRKVVHYWFKTGSLTTSNFLRHEINMFLNTLFGAKPVTNALLRVSSWAASDSEEDIEMARQAVREFSQAIFPYTIASLP